MTSMYVVVMLLQVVWMVNAYVITQTDAYPEEPIEEGPTEDGICQVFRTFDKDGNGTISREELRETMTNGGDGEVTDDNVDETFQEADTNDDGQITLVEFVAVTLNNEDQAEPHSIDCSQNATDTKRILKYKKKQKYNIFINIIN